MRKVEQDAPLVRHEKHFDRGIQPAYRQPMTLGDSAGGHANVTHGFKDRINIVSVRTSLVSQRHDRTTIQTNLALDIRSEGTRLNSSHVAISYAVLCL